MKLFNSHRWRNILLLLFWIILGLGLRFTNLAEKSPSSTEISTLGFSLGHGFSAIPLNQLISLDTLLSPLKFTLNTTPADVINRLMSESNHPPLYFILTHFWLQLFSQPGEIISLEMGRSLSAILGTMAIPAIFGLGWLAFHSRSIAHISAALMAVSPYAIYLSQEARHYTLTILWLIASLSCLVMAAKSISQQKLLPTWISCSWVIINGLGMATHYFFSLALCAEGLVIGSLWLWDYIKQKKHSQPVRPFTFAFRGYWWRIYGVAMGTAIACLVWLPVLLQIPNTDLAQWNGELETSYELGEFWQPLPRLLAWWITMVFLLPVEGVNTVILVISVLIVLGVLVWVIPAIIRGFRQQLNQELFRLSLQTIAGFFLSAIIIYLLIIYGLGKDLSLAARYHFVYFPAVIVVLGGSLAPVWHKNTKPLGKRIVIVVLILGFLGSLTVISNFGYQKSRRSDLLVDYIQNYSDNLNIIAMTYNTHAELRALMGLGVDFQSQAATFAQKTQFLLTQENANSSQITTLTHHLSSIQRPIELWAVNLKVETEQIEALNCQREENKPKVNGYRVRLYHCS
ncbi:MAG: glycosyltransferase family 39 protein [Microcoleaceae cyanobacterium]